MTHLIGDFVERVEYNSYEDFKKNFKIKIPENFNFAFDVVDKYAEIDENKMALVWTNDEESHSFTFSELKKISNQTANFFKSLGIKKEDKVILTLKNRYEFWISMVALHKIGAIAIPATHMLKRHDIHYRITNAEIKAVISVKEDVLLPNYESVEEELGIELIKIVAGDYEEGWIPFMDSIAEFSEEFERPTGEEATRNDSTLILYFTSGTSGEPKMIEHTHLYPLGHIPTAKYWQNVVDDGLHHTAADTGWGKAVWGNIYGQWISGTAIFIYDYVRFNGIKLIEHLINHKVTTFCAPPTIHRMLIKENIEGYDFSNIQTVTTAGEPLPGSVSDKFKEITGLRIREGFGQTESALLIGTYIWIEPKLESVGKPTPLFDIELLDNDGNLVDVGHRGEICLKVPQGNYPGLLKRYYKNPEKTDEIWYDDHYHCGDTVWEDEDGYFHFYGRTDDIIKSSGYRIGPYEVESAVLSHPACSHCAITGVPDELRGQLVKATIVLNKGYEPSDELIKEIQNHVKQTTAPYKYPRVIEFVDEIPETISGKIKRAEIRNNDIKKAQNE
ncbi:MAG: AMP-binding protein [archaeon]|nr:AMP-binding protein [archaeon]